MPSINLLLNKTFKKLFILAFMSMPVFTFASAYKIQVNAINQSSFKPMSTKLLIKNDKVVFNAQIPKAGTYHYTNSSTPSVSKLQGAKNLAVYVRNGVVPCVGGRFDFNEDKTITIVLSQSRGGFPLYSCFF